MSKLDILDLNKRLMLLVEEIRVQWEGAVGLDAYLQVKRGVWRVVYSRTWGQLRLQVMDGLSEVVT